MRFMRAMIVTAFAAVALANPISAQEKVTLYSRFSTGSDNLSAFDLESRLRGPRRGSWDFAYGNLRAGEDFDWFETSTSQGTRSLIRDLGELKWTDHFDVPVIEPFPKLKPGERRTVTVDVSGADGADGAPGRDGALGRNGRAEPVNSELGPVRPPEPDDVGVLRASPAPAPTSTPRPKRDGKPKIDPIFVKAVVGHVYAIHVVNDTNDYYALFRVEALTRGDSCTISWRLAPAPVAETVRKQK